MAPQQQAQQQVLQDHEIARRATRGAATYLARSGASQVIQAVSALAVARVLLPREYGVFALSLTLVGLVRYAGDLGVTYTLTVKREIGDTELRCGVAVALAVALIGGGLVAVIWPHLALVRAAGPSAVWVGPAMATLALIGVPAYPSQIVLERALRFTQLGVIQMVSAVVLFATQVTLLLLGVGLWSMVIAQVVGTLLTTVLTVHASGRFYLPSIRGPVLALVRDGLPYQGGVVATAVTGSLANILVAVQLGATGVGLFAWCTILSRPILGALSSVHTVASPTLARMRRDDGTRYDESVAVIARTLAAIAAVAAGCLIGVVSPTIRFVFAAHWLPATGAVQFCLAGTIPTAILSVLASDANARFMRRTTLASALVAGAATLVTLWPLAAAFGVAGASAAAFCIGPIAGAAVFVYGLRPRLTDPLFTAARLFLPLLALSFAIGRFVHSPVDLAAACCVIGVAGAGLAYLLEGRLVNRILRLMRQAGDRAGEAAAGAIAVPGSAPIL